MRTHFKRMPFGAVGSILLPLTAALAAACGSDDKAADTTPYPREKLLDPQTCSECHFDHYTQWSSSMHAYASTDPVFRAMNARGQRETKGALGDFCVKCHAPMATAEKATTDGSNLDQVDPKLQGITCYFCHNVTSVSDTHNNPLVLANDQTMRGSTKNPIKYKGHAAEYSPLFDDDVNVAQFQSSNLCGSCHDIVVPAALNHTADVPLEQTFSEWKSSVFADTSNGNKVLFNCSSGSGCHMGRVSPSPIANPPNSPVTMPSRTYFHTHDFPAIDQALVEGFPNIDQTNARSSVLPDSKKPPPQADRILDLLGTEFRVQICAPVRGRSSTNTVHITLENLSAGHRFPSGASQDRRVWAETHVFKGGQEVYKAGVVPPGVAATTIADAFLMYDQTLKADNATPAHMFWDVAFVKPETVPVSTTMNPQGNVIGSPNYGDANHLPAIIEPDRVTVTLWLEPIGLDVIDDLIATGDLDPGFRDKAKRTMITLAGEMPAPLPDGSPVSYEWTPDKALALKIPITEDTRVCTENTTPRFQQATTPPPL